MKRKAYLYAAMSLALLATPIAFAQTPPSGNAAAQSQAPAAQPSDTATPAPQATTSAPAADAASTASPTDTATPAADAAPVADSSERAHIIFYRPSRLSGMIYTYHVRETGEDGHVSESTPIIADLPNGTFVRYEAEPGIHNYNIAGPMAVTKDADRLRVELEAGETYYFQQTLHMGLITGGFMLVPSDQAHFDHERLHEAPAHVEQPAAQH
jgi:hypothetical protein